MAGTPLKRARAAERQADQLATYETVKRAPLPAPHTTPAEYGPERIPELLALASEGYDLAEIAAHWSISEDEVKAWGKACSAFQTALSHARAREKAWWSSRARLAIRDDNNRFPAGAWSHVMRARFPEYDDKQGVTVNIDLGSLVVVRLDAPEPLGERVPQPANPLIEGECVRLMPSPTVEGSPETDLSDASDDGSPSA
ncbi:hypothetical protein KOAAANKH_02545 [Brevundimonas sp. NIBR10]|uniref:hypothetical protein n=1 Tax=Brevundimonas sp. NIBR10 TaxID=3015997 RepID=UPI0022F18590|nr:hypothetical protein [Brevundimonas sp. NIBR10]WGM47663.1 hypothetical protein KOAAANKH_02545 [Brevundimonas sp. NIBR10]